MTSPTYTPDRRTIIVVKAEHQATANQIAQDATRNPDGTATTDLGTFTTGLQAAGQAPAVGAVVAYWANWAMTQAHRDAVIATLGQRFARAVTPIPAGKRPNLNDPFWVFDAEPGQWQDTQVFAALKMELIPNTE